LQKALLLNTGKSEDEITETSLLDSYTYVLFICIHHFFSGVIMLPVVIMGWEGTAQIWKRMFATGGMLCIGFDVEDLVTSLLLFFFPSTFKCFGLPGNLGGLIMSLFHHALSISMFLPVLIAYPEARPFHYIACSLLLAAGIAYGLGSYKFTLDTKGDVGAFFKYKGVVVIQFFVIWYTRAILWFPSAISLLRIFRDDPRPPEGFYFWNGLVVVSTMSLFNLVLLADCTLAAIKWLPRQRPSSAKEHAQLANSIAQSNAAQTGKTFGNAEQEAVDRGFITKKSLGVENLEKELLEEETAKQTELH